MGINILYPWVEPRDITAWAIFLAVTLLWIVAFVSMEIYFAVKVNRHGFQFSKESKGKIAATLELTKTRAQPLIKFDWESLDKAINDGKMLVVGNGKYVYDISKWIMSHPGGQIILHSVNGTDITNDYFHEAGFDATEFTPQVQAPARVRHEVPVINTNQSNVILVKRNNSVQATTGMYHGHANSPFDTEDRAAVLRTRRTHVHTRLALQKLAELVVGEMVVPNAPRASTATMSEVLEDVMFSSFEYRHYALTKFQKESPATATRPFVRLKFCILYPYDGRANQPTHFIPGQCVEIQVRLPTGERITRYYTPISGDMNAFEVMVKIQPGGKLSQYLFGAQKGERQFKIRGPFGTPLTPLPNHNIGYFPAYDTIYFFAGGSGITPFLQLASWLYLNTKGNLQVIQEYQATISDELNLALGDVVQITHHYNDGWCFGYNLSTNQQGGL